MGAQSGGGRRGAWLLAAGALLMVAGLALAAAVQSAGGVSVRDVRWTAADGTRLSALLYRPAGATAEHPAPGILAVHGYINTRETQSAFAIEFARRGWVVLALDQRGHGYSGGAAITKGFGGPEGLAYLRALPFVDRTRVGLEGHSMGGWTVLAAAAAMPDAYRAMVLEGSSTGAPFAQAGTPTWPRNLAVVYSRFDEFAPLMWGVPRAADVGSAPKLKALFATSGPVQPGRLYGDMAVGTARMLFTPVTTHPGDHLSTSAVGDAIAWFDRTLGAPQPRPATDQLWPWHELGTALALVGALPFVLGLLDLLLRTRAFAGLRGAPAPVRERRSLGWWGLLLATALLPALSFFVCVLAGPPPLLPPSPLAPQQITNWLVEWALVNLALTLAIGALVPGLRAGAAPHWGRSAALAALTSLGLYAVVALAALIPADLRFWVVGLRPLDGRQALAALVYALPFTSFTLVAFRGLTGLAVRGDGAGAQYLTAVAALASGFLVVTGLQYAWLFATAALPLPFEALNVIVAMQFVPVLAALAIVHVFCWRRTGGYATGGLLGGLLVTWYMVAGTATHV